MLVSFLMVLSETSMLLFMFRVMFVLIRVFRELDRYGLARLINYVYCCRGKKIYAIGNLRSMAEVVRKLSSHI